MGLSGHPGPQMWRASVCRLYLAVASRLVCHRFPRCVDARRDRQLSSLAGGLAGGGGFSALRPSPSKGSKRPQILFMQHVSQPRGPRRGCPIQTQRQLLVASKSPALTQPTTVSCHLLVPRIAHCPRAPRGSPDEGWVDVACRRAPTTKRAVLVRCRLTAS
jgi:hypothetical protein